MAVSRPLPVLDPARRADRPGGDLPSFDARIDYQRLRHTGVARLVRGAVARAIVGRDAWPVVFEAPVAAGEVSTGTSPHLYVHLPFCRQICPHCPYTKTLRDASLEDRYARALVREVRSYLARTDAPPVRSLNFGGGTPTATPDLIERVVELVRPHLVDGAEIGVEVHPADAGAALLARLHALGVTRVSLGIETFREDLLRTLARRYTPEQAEGAIRRARDAGFECVDVNLIFGIPGQQSDETAEDARRCLALGVDQISAYQLFTFVHTALGRRVRHGRFPVAGDRSRLLAQAQLTDACLEAGLVQTSPWNFTRPGIAPYSTVTHEDYVGFGAGAGSKVGGVFWFNTFSVDAYANAATHRPALVMQAGDRFRRAHWLYWQLYRLSVEPAEYRARFGRDLEADFRVLLRTLRTLGMVRRTGDGWRVTRFGSVWMHRFQQLYSITYIDEIWERCRGEAWPQRVVLR
jgi:oxygen-independent coproporphyrinogen-3 oxidase